MYCRQCGKKAPTGDKFCRDCGAALIGEQDSHTISEGNKVVEGEKIEVLPEKSAYNQMPKPAKKKRSRGIVVLAIVAILLILCGRACGSEEDSVLQKDVNRVLDRKIFIAKSGSDDIYCKTLNGADRYYAYAEDWTYRDLLNKKNFNNISWAKVETDDGVKVVKFSGIAKWPNYGPEVSIQFYIPESGMPVAWALDITAEMSAPASMSVEQIIQKGFVAEDAVVLADVGINLMLVNFSENPIM